MARWIVTIKKKHLDPEEVIFHAQDRFSDAASKVNTAITLAGHELDKLEIIKLERVS